MRQTMGRLLVSMAILLITQVGGFPVPSSNVEQNARTALAANVPAPMLTPRNRLGVVALNGRVYAIGGSSTPIVEGYDPVGNTWRSRASMPQWRQSFALAVATNGLIYATDGPNTLMDAFDPAANTWTPRSDALTLRDAPLAVGHSNGKVYIIGGPVSLRAKSTIRHQYMADTGKHDSWPDSPRRSGW